MSKFEIMVTRRLPEVGMELLAESCQLRLWEEDSPAPYDWMKKNAEGVDGIVCLLSDRIDKGLMDAAGNGLKAISTMAVGYDNIDVAEATRRNIAVGNTPGVLTEATADLTWALILSLARFIVPGDKMVRAGHFVGWSPTLMLGADFNARVIGIVGMGRIGQAVARRALGFGMQVVYHNRNRLDAKIEINLNARYVSVDELIEQSDFISLHCPLNDESRHMFGAEQFERMKSTAYIINVARGPVADETALVEALREQSIAGAAFDVYEREPDLAPGLTELDNVVLVPHLGSASVETRNTMARMTAENVLAGMKGKTPTWCVNPEALEK